MAHRHFFLENRRTRAVLDVNHGVVLNVRSIADADVVNITANRAVTPDRSLFANVYVADNLGTGFNVSGRVNLRVNPTKWSDHDFGIQIVTYAKLTP